MSRQILGSVGEPINPEAWRWYNEVVGGGRCPIVDTWWQTETGGHMITPLPGLWEERPGSATLPFFGVLPVILDDKVVSDRKRGLVLLAGGLYFVGGLFLAEGTLTLLIPDMIDPRT